MSKSPPTDVIRDGSLKASIWENEGERGIYFTTTFAKTYRNAKDELRDTSVFNNNDLLKVSELARQAYGRTNELRREMIQSRAPDQQDSTREERAKAYMKANRKSRSRSKSQEHER